VQRAWNRASLYGAPGKHGPGLRFKHDLHKAPHNLVNALLRGVYGIKVVLHSENAKPEQILLKITRSGKWRASVQAMFEEIVLEQVRSFP
jgi:hypothetical protein